MPPKVVKAKAPPKKVTKKKNANCYQMPEPVPNGEILTDRYNQQWKVGTSIGSGGFGVIYSASKTGTTKKAGDFDYVVKFEPHINGPLFAEMHFYMRNAKLEDIDAFRKQRGLKSLGMPHFIGNGSHELKNIKHRFIVMPRYGRDIWSIFLENSRKLPLHTIFRIAIQMLDVLEYIHKCTYVHADIKGANMLLGLGKNGNSQVYLVDFGLASHYTTKDFTSDPKKMHNGTIEYTSRDAHNGVPTMRGDFEILAYNIIYWSGVTLPWEVNKLLDNPTKVQEAKEIFMKDVESSIKKCFTSSNPCSAAIINYFKYVATLKFNDTPNYVKSRKFFEDELNKLGKPNSGDLEFKLLKSNPEPSKVTMRTPKKNPRTNTDKDKEIISPKVAKATKVTNVAPKIPSIEICDEEDEEIRTPPKKYARIANIEKHTNSEEKSSPQVKSKQLKSDSTKQNTTESKPVDFILSKELSTKGKKKDKTYELNFELDVSIDANVIINIKRKDKKPKKGINLKSAEASDIQISDNIIADTDDEIPSSLNNTPVANVRIYKKAATQASKRKSPRINN